MNYSVLDVKLLARHGLLTGGGCQLEEEGILVPVVREAGADLAGKWLGRSGAGPLAGLGALVQSATYCLPPFQPTRPTPNVRQTRRSLKPPDNDQTQGHKMNRVL